MLFEAGWVRGWRREFNDVSRGLRSVKDLEWFKNEHNEQVAARLKDLAPGDLKKRGDELTRRRDAQLVFGRRIDAKDFAGMQAKQVEKVALETFRPLAPLFQLHDARVLA